MTRVIQRSPDLGLTIKLQRLAAQAEPAVSLAPSPDPDPDPDPDPVGCPCDATAAMWAEVPALVGGVRTFSGATWGSADPPTFFQVRAPKLPQTHSWRFVGVPLGSAVGGVTWDLAWSIPPIIGETAVAAGPSFVVTIPAADPGLDFNFLTAKAYCGTTLVATLTFRLLLPTSY